MSDFTRAWEKMLAGLPGATDAAVGKVAAEIQDRASNSNLFKGTGGLRKSIRVVNNGAASRTVLADKDYAGYVEFGNNRGGPYIEPKNAKSLRFVANGSTVYARRVRTFGAKPFMSTAAKEVEPMVESIFEAELKDLL